MNITPLPIKEIKEVILTLPEITRLKKAIEDNPWHNHQSVFDHTMLVVKNLEKHTHKKFLIIAALFHDIAKPETLAVDPKTGYTTCMNHEQIGSRKIKAIGKRIGLKEKEIQYLERIVAYHGATHEMVNAIVENRTDEPYAGAFFRHYGVIGHDLLLLALADTEGCALQVLNSEGYRKRIEIMNRLINLASQGDAL